MHISPKYKYKCCQNELLHHEGFTLSAVQPHHIEKIRVWRNNQIDVLRQIKHIQKKEQIIYFKNNIWNEMNLEKPKNILLAFFKEEKFIGYGGLVHIFWEKMHAESSFLLDNSIQADSFNYRLCLENFFLILKKLAFDDLKFIKITSETYRHRVEHISMLEKIGFEVVEPLNNPKSIFHELKPI